MFNNFNGMCGAVADGMCRLSMSGQIAIKTSNGYKAYNVKTGRLTNCDNFCSKYRQSQGILCNSN